MTITIKDIDNSAIGTIKIYAAPLTKPLAVRDADWDAEIRNVVALDDNGDEMGHINLSRVNNTIAINELLISETYRRQGVGNALLQLIKYDARANNAKIAITLPSLRNANYSAQHSFYRKNGFEDAPDNISPHLYDALIWQP